MMNNYNNINNSRSIKTNKNIEQKAHKYFNNKKKYLKGQNLNSNNIDNNVAQQSQTLLPIKIFTQNIRGITTQSKQLQLIHFMELNKIQILGLSETKLKDNTAKYCFKQHKDYITYFDNNSTTPHGTGVGLIIHNTIAKYVHKVGRHKGRIIYIDLFLKGHKKLRIIQIYMNANIRERSQIEETYCILKNIVEEANTENSYIILMGDFNISPEKRCIDSKKWRYKILDILEHNDLIETYKVFNDIENNPEVYTFISNNPNLEPTRIDLIYTSRTLLKEILVCGNQRVTEYDSDHKALYMMLSPDIFEYKSLATLRQQKIKRRIYDYDKMDKNKWKLYEEATDNIVDKFKLDEMNIINKQGLNYFWNILSDQIYLAAISNIDNHMTAAERTSKNDLPKEIIDIRQDIKLTNKILMKLRNKYPEQKDIFWTQEIWSKCVNRLNCLLESYQQSVTPLPDMIIAENIPVYRKTIKELNKLLRLKYDLEYKKYQDKCIKEFVRKRCEDLKDNKKHMIDSLTDRKRRRIVIDRVIDKDNDGNDTLLIDPELIKEKTRSHFKTCAGSINEDREIPLRWKEQYLPRESIDPSIYSKLMSEPTFDEWMSIINQLPLGKAAGPSNITNEMWRHLGNKMQKIIWKFICACLKLDTMPDQWKLANLYPIPKPQDWECQLNNTRPIVLLETLRKALVRLLNNRLSQIFVKNSILKGNQFAGLPGSSTFEPIRIINEIIQDAKESKNEIWILFQDLSKAYDRVNIYMLEKALLRLKLPTSFIRMVTNLFLERKNKIFTEVGLTDEYKVLTGIDQGEVISPLLWCIYLDPLLCEIEKKELGYNLHVSFKKNVFCPQVTYDSTCISDVAFMDDTTWITESKKALESILEIADDFYDLNNIKVNKDKSILLTNNIEHEDSQGKINIQFGKETIYINNNKEPARLLGVWIYLKSNKQFVQEQAKNEVIKFCNIMRKKKATDKQMLYLWNMIIIPRIEYRTQITFLNKRECDSISSPFRKLFKYKLQLSSTAPNALMNNREIYNFRDIYEVQCQAKLTNFTIQINDIKILGDITRIRLKQIQVNENLINSPLYDWKITKMDRYIRSNFILTMITFCNMLNFTVRISNREQFSTQGGTISLRDILGPDIWHQNRKSIKTHNILFLEQTTTLKGDFLLHWRDIMRKNFITNASFKCPKWFKMLEQKILVNHSTGNRSIIASYIKSSCNLKGHDLEVFDMYNNKKEWVTVWNPILNRSIIGKILKKIPDSNQLIIEHWTFNNDQLFEQYPTISLCSGCQINNYQYNVIERKYTFFETTCTNIYNRNDVFVINNKKTKALVKNKSYRISCSIFEILQQAEFHFCFIYNFIMYKDNEIFNFESYTNLPILEKFIKKGPAQKKLFLVQEQLKGLFDLEFYIEGNIKDSATTEVNAAFGFIQSNITVARGFENVEFISQCENFLTKRKTLLLATMSALIASPYGARVNIFTFDPTFVSTITKMISNSHTIRDFFRLNFGSLFFTIKNIIRDNKLEVFFNTLKADQHNFWTYKLHSLLREAHDPNVPLLIPNLLVDEITFFPIWNDLYIENNLRKFFTMLSRSNGFHSWFNLFRNNKYTSYQVDWFNTFHSLNEGENLQTTDFILSYNKSRRIKYLIEELPTVEHLKKSRPDLYTGWFCPVCCIEKENFSHIWLCEKIIDQTKYIAQHYKKELIELIQEFNSRSNLTVSDIELDSIWEVKHSSLEFTFIDLIKGIVPLSLSRIISSQIHNRDNVSQLLEIFFHRLQGTISLIWEERCKCMIDLELKLGIDRKLKRIRKTDLNLSTYSRPSSVVNSSLSNFNNYDIYLMVKCGGSYLNYIYID